MVVSVLQHPPPADVQRSGVVRGSVGCMLMHFFETFGLVARAIQVHRSLET